MSPYCWISKSPHPRSRVCKLFCVTTITNNKSRSIESIIFFICFVNTLLIVFSVKNWICHKVVNLNEKTNILNKQFRQSNEECANVRKDLSKFNILFLKITELMYGKLMEKYLQIPIEEILLKYQSTVGAEKEFLNLLLVQGKNNITTVIIAILNTWNSIP